MNARPNKATGAPGHAHTATVAMTMLNTKMASIPTARDWVRSHKNASDVTNPEVTKW